MFCKLNGTHFQRLVLNQFCAVLWFCQFNSKDAKVAECESCGYLNLNHLKLLFNNESGCVESTEKGSEAKIDPATPSHNLLGDNHNHENHNDDNK